MNELELKEEYEFELDRRDTMRASARLVDEKWAKLMEQSMEKLVVIFFTMNCGREGLCNMVAPEFEKLSQEYSGAIFVKMDIDAPFHGQILSRYGIHKQTAMFLFFRDGQMVDELRLQLGGSKPFPGLRAKVQLVFNKHKPADGEVVVTPVRQARALCSHEGCTNQFQSKRTVF